MVSKQRFLLLLFFFFSAFVAVAQRSVEARLDSTHILIGSQTRLALTVRVPRGAQIAFPDLAPKSTLTEGVEIVRVEETDTVAEMPDMLELRRNYVLTSFDSADYHFTAPLIVIDGDTLRAADTLSLSVTSVPVDTLHIDRFYGAKDVETVPFVLNWCLVAFLVSALLFMVLAVWLWRRYKSLKPRVERVVKMPPPAAHEVALAALQSLRADSTSFADEAERHDALVETLRIYIKSRFGLDCREMTSSQILDALRLHNHYEALDSLATALRATDYVRFAGQRREMATAHDAFMSATAYVEATKENLPLREPIITEKVETDAVFIKRRRAWLATAMVCALAALGCVAWIIVELISLF